MKNIWTISVAQMKPSHANTKEKTVQSMKNVLQYVKRHISSIKQWKNQACSLDICLSEESFSLSVSQSVQNSDKINDFFPKPLFKAFQVDLEAWLGLVLPNQYCPIII